MFLYLICPHLLTLPNGATYENNKTTIQNTRHKIMKFYDKEVSENRLKFTNFILGLKYAIFSTHILCY